MRWRSMMKKRMFSMKIRRRRDLIQKKQAKEDHQEKRKKLLNKDVVTFKNQNGT
jgi:hypothetical protein